MHIPLVACALRVPTNYAAGWKRNKPSPTTPHATEGIFIASQYLIFVVRDLDEDIFGPTFP